MFDMNSKETQFAIRAVRQACQLVKLVQAEMVTSVLTKEDRSPVTVADFASQALVGKLLEEAFPQDLLVAEEDSSALRQPGEAQTLEHVTHFVGRFLEPAGAPRPEGRHVATDQVCAWIDRGGASAPGNSARGAMAAEMDPGIENPNQDGPGSGSQAIPRFWTLDPIDGTKGFLRGDQYAIALALIVDGQVQIGVLGCPNLAEGYRTEVGGPGTLAVGLRGGGAWAAALVDGAPFMPLGVSPRSNPAQARLLRSFESGHTNVSQIDIFASALGVAAEPVRMDSQAKYVVLAAGRGEIYLRLLSPRQPDYREKIWDQAAGSLLVEQAGGRVSDLHGRPLDFNSGRELLHNRGVLASNGILHPAALQALQNMQA